MSFARFDTLTWSFIAQFHPNFIYGLLLHQTIVHVWIWVKSDERSSILSPKRISPFHCRALCWALCRSLTVQVYLGTRILSKVICNMLNFIYFPFSYFIKMVPNYLFYSAKVVHPNVAIDKELGNYLLLGNVSDCRYMSDCRSRGREFDHGPVPYFLRDWSWTNCYDHSPLFRWFKEGCCQL